MQEKLDKCQAELRRAQAELRMNQNDYDRNHVEVEQLQEKIAEKLGYELRGHRLELYGVPKKR